MREQSDERMFATLAMLKSRDPELTPVVDRLLADLNLAPGGAPPGGEDASH